MIVMTTHMKTTPHDPRCGFSPARLFVAVMAIIASTLAAPLAQAQETVCARVKIEIKQELTLERQAFDAEMKINNTTDTGVIENVSVVVKVTDENGTPVAVTDNPNNLSAKFFVRLSNKQNISDVDGTGAVNPRTTSTINWLLIPAPGSAGANPLGKKYLVGATLKYKFGGEETVLEVSPDVITVKPLPLLTLDYFLTQNVLADNPLTPEIEPVEPFTLGVRVKNNGFATAKNLKIDSAQPKIIENNQGLLINFILTGSFLNDAPAQNTLLINFGDIAPTTSKMGRWNMETTLAGKFTEFTAKFSHADELGGALTSILQATNAHFLIHDVRVDLAGRDYVRDFLAQDGDVIRVYESDGPDTEVTDRSNVATLTAGTSTSGNASFRLGFPATAGFAYVKLPDPYNGSKALGRIVRSDAKELASENVWLSKTRNESTKQWEYWVNFFDVNTTGVYNSEFQAPPAVARPPAVQLIANRVVQETKQVSFLVEASSPDGKPVTLSAAPLPTGATFTPQAADPAAPGVARAIFDWAPAKGSAGSYLISYTANDGSLSAARSASIQVETDNAPPGPSTPTIVSPLSGAQVTSFKPTLSVQTSTNPKDPTTKVQFEVYADEAGAQLVVSTLVAKTATGPTAWTLPSNLNDNARYWWRARAFDGAQTYSLWVNSQFTVNLFNDPPDSFALLSPAASAEVAVTQPQLSWNNARDKDGDIVTYRVQVYSDAALNTVFASVNGLVAGSDGMSGWLVDKPLANNTTYYWRVFARDSNGAETATPARPFVVKMDNRAPSLPVIVAPAVGATVTSNAVELIVGNAVDVDGNVLTYVFELDVENTFATASKRRSEPLAAGNGQTRWAVTGLVENKWYYWRVIVSDGRTDSGWRIGRFLVDAVNDPPALPSVRNPDVGAWLATNQPTLELNPVIDPEGDAVRYEFELSSRADSGGLLVNGSAAEPKWTVSAALADRSTYWWRYRAIDVRSAASAWSAWRNFTVNTSGNLLPSIQLLEPAVPMVPSVQSGRKVFSLRWEGVDVGNGASVSLYYATSRDAPRGTPIVEGIGQGGGSQLGSYVWDVTDLASGTYYIYADIYDTRGVARAGAPGALVVPAAVQSGRLLVRSGTGSTDETGKIWPVQVKLNAAPTADVVVPLASSNEREGGIQPKQMVFTAQNWATYQNATVKGVDDCTRDGNQKYWISIGQAGTLDPNFIGSSASSLLIVNIDNGLISGTCAQQ